MRGIVNVVANRVSGGRPFSSLEICLEAGASRQAVHKHLSRLVRSGVLTVSGKARATRYSLAEPLPQTVVPLRQRVQVASAGSRYRLSARLLMLEVAGGLVEVDFSGISELGEEFLEELFLVWAPKNPSVTLVLVHLPARFAPAFFDFARRARASGALARTGDEVELTASHGSR